MMKVYEQIELMSKSPKPRRSKSFTRSDRHSISRTSSPQNDFTSSCGSRSRQSSDAQPATPRPSSNSGSRTSFEKSRALRMFTNNKYPVETEIPSDHKKSESLRSESSRNVQDDDSLNPAEDAEMLREFDDLMRSTSTMKVSLTPDRLQSMEVYKQQKDQKGNRRPGVHFSSNSEPVIPASRANIQRPSVRPVESIIEDEEDRNIPKSRTRQASVATPPSSSFVAIVPNRTRSVSTSSGIRNNFAQKPARSPSVKNAPSSFSLPAPAVDMVQSRDRRIPNAPASNGFPARTQTRQRNRDSLDLDDVMNGSDDDDYEPSFRGNQPRSPLQPKRGTPSHAVSARTRELMDFLAEGPPEPQVSLADGPSDDASNAHSESSKPKGAGRLQRMISKLSLGNAEKAKVAPDTPRTPHPNQVNTPMRPTITSKPSSGTLSSLANRPIPPRMPSRPISPPSSPSQDSSDENKLIRSPPRKPYPGAVSREPSSAEKPPVERSPIERPSPPVSPPVHLVTPAASFNKESQERSVHRPSPNSRNGNGSARTNTPPKEVTPDIHPVVPVRTTSHPPPPTRKPPPALVTPSAPSIPEPDVRAMQRLLSNATTADECRLILDMFMARCGIPREQKAQDVPYPSPPPSIVKHTPYAGGESALETSLVHLFLGGSVSQELALQQPSAQQVPIDELRAENELPNDNTSQNTHFRDGVPLVSTHSMVPIRV